MSSNIVGSAYVEIHAITDKIGSEIKKALENVKIDSIGSGNHEHLGKNLARDVMAGFDQEFKKSGGSKELDKYIKNSSGSAKKEITKALKSTGGKKGSSIFDAILTPSSQAFKEAQHARSAFNDLARSGMKMSSIIGVVITSVGDLVGGLGALVFGAAAAAPAFIAFAGVMVSAQIGVKAVKIAMEGVDKAAGALWTSQTALNDSLREASQQYIDIKFQAEGAALAQQGAALALQQAKTALIRAQDLPQNSQAYQQAVLSYKQANLNYAQSVHKTQEATRAVQKGITATAAYQPFASLSNMQLQFVKFIVTLRPAMQELRTVVSNGFIPALENGIKGLMSKTFPTLRSGLISASGAMGKAVSSIFAVFTDPKNIGYLKQIFDGAAKNIPTLGHAFATFMQIALRMLAAAQPLIKVFVDWIDRTATSLDKKFSNSKKLEEFFNNAGVVAAKLGGIIGNVSSILGSFIKANTGPGSGGQILLDWIQTVTGDFATFLKTGEGASSTFSWFKGAAENFKVMSQTIGKFVKPLFTLAGNADVRAMWTRIGDAAPFFADIVSHVQKAAKPMGDFVFQLLRVIDILTDQTQIKAFFDTLTKALKWVGDFLSTPMVKAIMKFMGPITGVLLALGSIGTIGGKVFKALVGHIGWPIGQFKKLKDAIGGVSEAEAKLRGVKATEGIAPAAKRIFGSVKSDKFIGPLEEGQVRASDAKGFIGRLQGASIKSSEKFDAGVKSAGNALKPSNISSGFKNLTAPLPGATPGGIKKMMFDPATGRSWTETTKAASKFENAMARSTAKVKGSFFNMGTSIGQSLGVTARNIDGSAVKMGLFQKIGGGFTKFGAAANRGFSMAGQAFGKFTQILKGNWILLLIGLLVVSFIKLYNSNKQFANFVNGSLKKVMGVLSNALGSIMKALGPLIDMFFGKKGLVPQLMVALMPALKMIIDIFVFLVQIILPPVVAIIDVIIGGIELLVSNLMTAGAVLKDFFTGNWGNIGNDITEGINRDIGIVKNTASSVAGAFTGTSGSDGVGGANGTDGANGTTKTTWAEINKKQQDAAQKQVDAANTQYKAALEKDKKGSTYTTRTDVAITKEATRIAAQRKVDTSSAFDQMLHYSGIKGKEGVVSNIKTGFFEKLANAKGAGSTALKQEYRDFIVFNQNKTQLEMYKSAYDAARTTALKTGKKSDKTAAANALLTYNSAKTNYDATKGAYKNEFANISYDPKTGKVTVGGAPTTTGAGSTATGATGTTTTTTTAPDGTTSTSTTGKGTTGGTFNGSATYPYYVMIGDLTKTDWKAIRDNISGTKSTEQLILAQNITMNTNMSTLIGIQKQMNTVITQSAVRDAAFYEHEILHESNKDKGKFGGKDMKLTDINVLATSVTGLKGVAGFN